MTQKVVLHKEKQDSDNDGIYESGSATTYNAQGKCIKPNLQIRLW